MPGFGAAEPMTYFSIPEDERSRRCQLGNDDCVIDDKWFYIRGCIEISVHGEEEPLIWGVWTSLSKESHLEWRKFLDEDRRSHIGPFFGWLDAWLKPYPDTINMKTWAHLRDNGIRPFIELEPTDHPLSLEQREGIKVDRVAEIYAIIMHEEDT